MAETALTAVPPLGGYDEDFGAVRLAERADLALVSVAVPLGDTGQLAKALKSGWKLGMPEPRMSVVSGGMRAIRTAPDQIFLVFPHATPDAETVVQAKLKGAGYTTDQTDNWVVLDISGPGTLAALERLCPLDLDSNAFPIGASARTVMEHMGAMILRMAADRFLLLSASSSARSFLHAVKTSIRYTL